MHGRLIFEMSGTRQRLKLFKLHELQTMRFYAYWTFWHVMGVKQEHSR